MSKHWIKKQPFQTDIRKKTGRNLTIRLLTTCTSDASTVRRQYKHRRQLLLLRSMTAINLLRSPTLLQSRGAMASVGPSGLSHAVPALSDFVRLWDRATRCRAQ